MIKRNQLQNSLGGLFSLFGLYIEEIRTLYNIQEIRYYYYNKKGFNENSQVLYNVLKKIVLQIKEQNALFKELYSIYIVQNDQPTSECLEEYYYTLGLAYNRKEKAQLVELLGDVFNILKQNNKSLTSQSLK